MVGEMMLVSGVLGVFLTVGGGAACGDARSSSNKCCHDGRTRASRRQSASSRARTGGKPTCRLLPPARAINPPSLPTSVPACRPPAASTDVLLLLLLPPAGPACCSSASFALLADDPFRELPQLLGHSFVLGEPVDPLQLALAVVVVAPRVDGGVEGANERRGRPLAPTRGQGEDMRRA